MNKNGNILLLVTLLITQAVFGQLGTPTKPQSSTFQQVEVGKSYSTTPSTNTGNSNSTQSRNQYGAALQGKKADEMINYGTTNASSTPDNIYNSLSKDNYTLASNAFIPPKQIQSINYVKSLVNEIGYAERSVSYQLPSLQTGGQGSHFEETYKEIVDMLEGRKPLSLKRAVFLTENAWFGGGMKYEDYSQLLNESAYLIKLKMMQEGMPVDNNQAINYMAHQYMSDTLKIDLKFQEKIVTTYPKTYDFNDPFGYNDVRKMFVSKLMFENNGQCKSLPLYYLMLVEALGGEAYLSFSPSHSYAKCKDANGELFNIELTNGMLTTDSWVVGSGYVKSEAVKSGIYLDTLNKKQVIANCLVDLARYYQWRFGKPDDQEGYDSFSLKCINQTLKYHPTNIYAILQKSNYYTALMKHVSKQLNAPTPMQLKGHPKAIALYNQMNKLYALTDGLGYEEMPQEAYMDWLKTLEEKAQQQEHEKQYLRFSKITTSY